MTAATVKPDPDGPHPSGDTKTCQHEPCAKTFTRKRREGPKRWGIREFCGAECAAKGKRKTVKPPALSPVLAVVSTPERIWRPSAPGFPAQPNTRPCGGAR